MSKSFEAAKQEYGDIAVAVATGEMDVQDLLGVVSRLMAHVSMLEDKMEAAEKAASEPQVYVPALTPDQERHVQDLAWEYAEFELGQMHDDEWYAQHADADCDECGGRGLNKWWEYYGVPGPGQWVSEPCECLMVNLHEANKKLAAEELYGEEM